MSILVTGATGFLGFNLVNRLIDQGEDVLFLTRKDSPGREKINILLSKGARQVEFDTPSDLQILLSKINFTEVFHLATHYLKSHESKDIRALTEANLVFGTYLLEACIPQQPLFVSTQSFFQYQSGSSAPLSLYASLKESFSIVSKFYESIGAIRLREVVIFDTYGPGDSRDKLVPLMTSAIQNDTSISLGNPDQLINLLHVEDVIDGLIACRTANTNSLMQLKSTVSVSVSEIVETYSEVANYKLNVKYNHDAPLNNHLNQAGSWPLPANWKPRIDLSTGLKTLLN